MGISDDRTDENDYLTVEQARALLAVSPRKMADILKRGALPSEPNPFDRRSKLVRRADVEALRAKQPRTEGKEAA